MNQGFPGDSDGKESACHAGDLGLIPGLGVGQIPWRRAWQLTPVFSPGESPWTEEPGGLQSMGWQRVRHDWATKHSTHSTAREPVTHQGFTTTCISPGLPLQPVGFLNIFFFLNELQINNLVENAVILIVFSLSAYLCLLIFLNFFIPLLDSPSAFFTEQGSSCWTFPNHVSDIWLFYESLLFFSILKYFLI